MPQEQITITVGSAAASAYRSATAEERRKLNLLLSLYLLNATQSQKSLREVLDEISRKAEKRGLTAEILQAILNEQ